MTGSPRSRKEFSEKPKLTETVFLLPTDSKGPPHSSKIGIKLSVAAESDAPIDCIVIR